jgi:hypothetical protein
MFAQRLPCLVGWIVDDGHGRVVEAGGAGDERPLAVDNRPAVPASGFER